MRDTCGDCGVQRGEKHAGGCDVARCLWTGGQRLGCEGGLTADCVRVLRTAGRGDLADHLAYYHSLDDEDHDCGEDVWNGEFPGVSDAARLGLWCYGPPWKPCTKDYPGATEDLNRLYMCGEWNRATLQWEMP